MWFQQKQKYETDDKQSDPYVWRFVSLVSQKLCALSDLRGEIMKTRSIQSSLNILSLKSNFGNICGTELFSLPNKDYHWVDLLLKKDEIA